ncbi:hypothetical protein DPV73_11055 [Leptospira mayottensis]|nr:hypothetical protein DPV73_11055 [Leptospira mayottensis]
MRIISSEREFGGRKSESFQCGNSHEIKMLFSLQLHQWTADIGTNFVAKSRLKPQKNVKRPNSVGTSSVLRFEWTTLYLRKYQDVIYVEQNLHYLGCGSSYIFKKKNKT